MAIVKLYGLNGTTEYRNIDKATAEKIMITTKSRARMFYNGLEICRKAPGYHNIIKV